MIDRAIIQRYLDGKATEEDLLILQTYLKKHDLSLLEEQMIKDWKQLPHEPTALPPEISEAMLRRIKRDISPTKRRKLSGMRLNTYWAAAAGIILLIGIGLWLFLPVPVTEVAHATSFGEWKTLNLPDGSWVKLNANSKIRYASRWEQGEDRQVWLDGEAFFQVQKKAATGAKFQVITKDLQVEVLGTSFNVNSRNVQTDVFLEEGTIKLSMGEEEELLQPGDFLAYSAQKRAVVKRQNAIPAELHTSWKNGVLILKDKPIAEILKKLEELYGVQFEIQDQNLLKLVKTISVPMDKLEIAIPVLERTFEINITQQGSQLLIQ